MKNLINPKKLASFQLKFDLKMKLTTFFLIVSLFQIHANSSYGQKTKITLDLENVSLEKVLNKIETLTEFKFLYNDKEIDYKKIVTVHAKKEKISRILEKLFSNTNVSFEVFNRQIILKSSNENKTLQVPKKSYDNPKIQQKEISGTITDENGQPLPEANIIVKGTSVGTTSDFDGKFTLKVPDDAEILVISFIGYKTKEITIGTQTTFKIILHEDAANLDEVVIGIRQSLNKAVDIKKDAINSVDAIVAEDIAKFPQSNVSESLQRVSGIQIRRDNAGGVGNEVSIRGLPPEYTQVTINGQAAPNSSEATRTYNFNSVPAELFGKIEVFKTPTAKLDEGGIGGTVNLVTRKPFELSKQVFVASVEGIYNTQQQDGSKVAPKISLTYGNKWNNKFGIIAGVSYNKFFNASEGYDVVRYRERSYDIDDDGTDDFTNIRIPLPRYVSQGQEVERLAFNLGAQYKVNDNFIMSFDGIYTNNNQVETRYAPIWFLQGPTATEIRADGQFLQFGTFEDVTLRLENQQQENDTHLLQLGLTGDWNFNDWQVVGNVNYSSNNRDIERFRYYADNTNTVTYSVENDNRWFDIQTPTDLTDASQFTMSEARRRELELSDKIISGQLDFTKKINTFQLDFGVKYRSRNKDRIFFDDKVKNINEPFAPVAVLLTDFLNNVDEATGPTEFLVHDWDRAFELYGSKIDISNSEVEKAYYDITENIAASYAMGTFKLPKFKLNAGLRLVNTSLIAKGLELDETTGNFSNREVKSSYTDLLPSINTSYELGKNFFVKGAFARVMTRPSLGDLTSYREIDDANFTISEKNPELEPFRANQYDLSLEWYPKKGALLSIGYFRKNIESFITTETTTVQLNGNAFQLTRPVNGNDATINGIEFNYQQPFTFLPSPFDGLGVVVNYTLSDSDFKEVVDLGTGETESYQLPNNSKNSYNLVAYYEKYGFSFRIAHNYRSDFLRSKPVPADGLKFRDDYSQTDISAGYDISKKLSVTLNILNAFNSQRYEYIFERKFQDNVSVFGRTFQFGMRYSL